jgi:hypothetical protein
MFSIARVRDRITSHRAGPRLLLRSRRGLGSREAGGESSSGGIDMPGTSANVTVLKHEDVVLVLELGVDAADDSAAGMP